MEIRARAEGDLDDLVGVAARVHEVDSYPIFLPGRDYVGFLSRPQPLVAWVAVDGELLGHVALNGATSRPVMRLVDELGPAFSAVYVARLLVDPGSRRRGVGRRLLEHARRAAVDMGHSAFVDVVDTPTARPAISLYRGDGWEEIGRVSFDLVDDQVHELVFRAPAPWSARPGAGGAGDTAG